MSIFVSTEVLALMLFVKPATIRSGYSRQGHYLGLRPVKLQNRRLVWNKSDATKLFVEGGETSKK